MHTPTIFFGVFFMKRVLLLEYRIGLTDLVKDAHGNDGAVRRADDNDRQALRAKVSGRASASVSRLHE
jgi:hypothetical protein